VCGVCVRARARARVRILKFYINLGDLKTHVCTHSVQLTKFIQKHKKISDAISDLMQIFVYIIYYMSDFSTH